MNSQKKENYDILGLSVPKVWHGVWSVHASYRIPLLGAIRWRTAICMDS